MFTSIMLTKSRGQDFRINLNTGRLMVLACLFPWVHTWSTRELLARAQFACLVQLFVPKVLQLVGSISIK